MRNHDYDRIGQAIDKIGWALCGCLWLFLSLTYVFFGDVATYRDAVMVGLIFLFLNQQRIEGLRHGGAKRLGDRIFTGEVK